MTSRATTVSETVPAFLREHRDRIVRKWESLVLAEGRRVELAGLGLRDTIPAFLDELAGWLRTGAPPGSQELGASSLQHVLHRLDQGLELGQVLDEYRLLREAILSSVLEAEQREQARAGPGGEDERKKRVVELARLNAGLDVAISGAIVQFVAERDRRAAKERERNQLALRASEERLRALVQASSDAVYRMDPDWSEMRHLVGRDFIADTLDPSRSWLQTYIPPDDQPNVQAHIDEAIQAKSVFELEHRVLRVDGTFGWTLSRAVPLLDASGEIVEWFGTASDITQRKRAEEALQETERRLRTTLADRETLLREVHHRVKNNLEVIDSLLHLQAQAFPNPQVRAALSDASNRVHAIAQVHRLLYGSPDLATVTVNAFAGDLAQFLLSIFGVEPSRVRVTVEGSLQLDLRRAVPVGLILNELIANSLKHAFPEGRSGVVMVALGSASRDGPQFNVSVCDDGVGIPDRARDGSLGLRLVRVLAEQLRGSVEIEGGSGTTVTLSFPAPVSA